MLKIHPVPPLPAVSMIVELLVMLNSPYFAWKQCGFTLGSAQSHIPTHLCLLVLLSDRHTSLESEGERKKRDFWWVFLQPVCVCKTMCMWVCIEEKPKAQECEYKTIRALLRDRGSGSHLASGSAGYSTMERYGLLSRSMSDVAPVMNWAQCFTSPTIQTH